jgi:methylthioribose-1-phosphate isomerase
MLTSIRISNEKIEIIDQLLLPHTTEYVEITSIEVAHDAIRDMKVRNKHISTHPLRPSDEP